MQSKLLWSDVPNFCVSGPFLHVWKMKWHAIKTQSPENARHNSKILFWANFLPVYYELGEMVCWPSTGALQWCIYNITDSISRFTDNVFSSGESGGPIWQICGRKNRTWTAWIPCAFLNGGSARLTGRTSNSSPTIGSCKASHQYESFRGPSSGYSWCRPYLNSA